MPKTKTEKDPNAPKRERKHSDATLAKKLKSALLEASNVYSELQERGAVIELDLSRVGGIPFVVSVTRTKPEVVETLL